MKCKKNITGKENIQICKNIYMAIGILFLSIFVIILIIIFLFRSINWNNVFNSNENSDEDLKVKEINIKIDSSLEELLIKRLSNLKDFEEKVQALEIETKRYDWPRRSYGIIKLSYKKESLDKLKELLINSGKTEGPEDDIFDVVDEYDAIYIDDDDKNIVKLVFQWRLPYKIEKNTKYNEFIEFFLNI